MASGNFSSNTGTNLNLYIAWSSTTNVSANASSVTVNVYSRSYTINGNALADSYVTVNGNTKSLAGISLSQSVSNLTNKLLATHTVTVPHNSDGTKSITIKANIEFNGTVSGKYLSDITASQTVTLDTIPRASGLSVATSVNTGSSLTTTISPASSAFTHKVAYIIGGSTKFTSGTIAAGTNTYAYTIPHSWLPSTSSATMTVRLFTYSGSTEVGRVDKSVTVNVPASIVPTVSTLAPTIVNGLSGYYVEGKSQIKLVATATTGSGSTLTSYVFTGPNISGNASSYTSTSATVTSSVIKTSGTIKYGVVARDARGRQSAIKETSSITVYPYATPQITSITAQRCDANGNLSTDGTYAKVTVKASYSSVNGANKRTVTLYSSKDNYATGTVVLASTNTNDTFSGVYGSGFALGTSYTIRAVITDSYNTGTTINKSVTLKVAERTLNIAKYGNGLSIGGLSSITSATDAPKFECNWDATFAQQVRINDSVSRSFEINRLNMLVDVNNDGVNESAYIRGQYFIDDEGQLVIRRRYSLDSGVNHTTQGYLRIGSNGMYVGYGIETPCLQVTSTVDADGTTQNDVALRVGNPSGTHIDMDGNELIAKNGPTKMAELYLAGSAIGLYSGETSALVIGTDATNAYVQSAPAYARTYTGAANMYITSSGTFGRSTASSERYKKDIENVTDKELDPYKILNIPVRQYRYNEDNIPIDGKPEDLYIGLVAEEVAKEYPIAAEYTEDGQVEMWNIKSLFPALLKIVQDQQKKIEALEEQINNKAVNE